MQPLPTVAIVEAWLDAVNRQDVDRLLALSSPNIELVGPRGVASGHQILRQWLGRAGLTLQTHRRFVRGEFVVLAQHGIWTSPETGSGRQDVASSFRVDGERVARYARYDDLETALADAGLAPEDEFAV